MKLLEIEGLTKEYGIKDNVTKALNGLDLTVMKGEFLGIMGSSGSGKTTLLNCVSTMIRPSSGTILLNGENVNPYLRTEEVGNMASLTSKNPKVRERLTQLQKELARRNDVVMDGRDIGTCVLPDADVKVYLTASVEVRAKRRYDELTAKGVSCDIHQIEEDIAKRDEQDMNREIAPLKQAEDAVLVDSSNMTIDEVVQAILTLCK